MMNPFLRAGQTYKVRTAKIESRSHFNSPALAGEMLNLSSMTTTPCYVGQKEPAPSPMSTYRTVSNESEILLSPS